MRCGSRSFPERRRVRRGRLRWRRPRRHGEVQAWVFPFQQRSAGTMYDLGGPWRNSRDRLPRYAVLSRDFAPPCPRAEFAARVATLGPDPQGGGRGGTLDALRFVNVGEPAQLDESCGVRRDAME